MMSVRASSVAVFLAVSAVYPQISAAQTLTADRFLSWSVDEQDTYIQNAVFMAAVVFTDLAPDAPACVDEWYLGEAADPARRNAQIRETISERRQFQPATVIYAFLKRACGPFN